MAEETPLEAHVGKETGLVGKLHEDYEAYDVETQIGRIYLDQQTLKAGRWYWSIQ
jgi:hypothetical protein